MPVKEKIEGVIIGVPLGFEERTPLVVYLRKPEKTMRLRLGRLRHLGLPMSSVRRPNCLKTLPLARHFCDEFNISKCRFGNPH